MRLSNCRQCDHHVESVADCALCDYEHSITYRAMEKGNVISCPLDRKGR